MFAFRKETMFEELVDSDGPSGEFLSDVKEFERLFGGHLLFKVKR